MMFENSSSNDVILTQNINVNTVFDGIKRNDNVFVMGHNDNDIANSYIIPNIMQANKNYVVTDIDGKVFAETEKHLKEQGYEVKLLDFNNISALPYLNPFAFITNYQKLKLVIDCIMDNTDSDSSKTQDPFWRICEAMLLESIFAYIWMHRPSEERNPESIIKQLKLAGEESLASHEKNQLDELFENLAKFCPNSDAVILYNKFRSVCKHPSVLKSIVIGCCVRLTSFVLIKNPEHEHFDFSSFLNEEKKALFIIPDSKNLFDLMISLIYLNLSSTTKTPTGFIVSKTKSDGKFPCILNFIIREMHNPILSYSVIVNNIEHFKTAYPQSWESILSTFDNMLLLDNKENENVNCFINTSLFCSSDKSHKDLYNEISSLSDDECMLSMRGRTSETDKKHT